MTVARKEPWGKRQQQPVHNATRAALIDAAGHVFARSGYAATTVARIASEAGTSRAGFYVYFSSKADVFAALADDLRAEITAAQRGSGPDEDPALTIERAVSGFFDLMVRHAELLTVLSHQALADPELAAVESDIYHAPIEAHQHFVERLQRNGHANPAAPPRTIAEAMVGMITRFATKAMTPAERDERRQELVAIYKRLIHFEES